MLSADRRGLFVAGGDGAISEGNLTLGSAKETPVPGDQHEFITPFASPGALGRARFYVGVGRADHQGVAREIRVFDPNTWARVGTIRTSTPFLSAVTTRDGSVIYALRGAGEGPRDRSGGAARAARDGRGARAVTRVDRALISSA